MVKTNPIPMIKDHKQLSSVRIYTCFQYTDSGLHVYGNCLLVYVYGVNKDGDTTLIALCPITTGANYIAMQYASCISTAIPVKDYSHIVIEYDKNNTTFKRFVRPIHIEAEVKELQEVFEDNQYEQSLEETVGD